MTLTKILTVSSLGFALSSVLGSATAFAQQQEFEARYFSQTTVSGELRSTKINTALLSDSDLIRGNNSDETIVLSSSDSSATSSVRIFNGILRFDRVNLRVIPGLDSGESLVAVYFNDGTMLDDVLAIRDRVSGYASIVSTSSFLLDQSALLNAGKTLNDIVEVSVNASIEHSLNYSDLGFVPAGELPPISTEISEPAITEVNNTQLNVIVGTRGRDNLEGTNGDDYIDGRGGSRDVLTGNEGNDFFIFGTEAGNNSQDRDVIVDFDVIDDTLVLENGASIASTKTRNGSLVIKLTGRDKDTIRLRKVAHGIGAINVISVDDDFE